jgi:hypothetical protein
MTDPRPKFETETFTPFELYDQSGHRFGFHMKSWAQPHYGGSIVEVVGWLYWGYRRDGSRFPLKGAEVCSYIDEIHGVEKTIDAFVCTRSDSGNNRLLIIENVYGKGWLLHV